MSNREFRAARRDPYAGRRTRDPGVSPSLYPAHGVLGRVAVACLIRLPRVLAYMVVSACFVELVLRTLGD